MASKARLTRLIHEELEPRLLFSAGAETVLITDVLPGTEASIVETVTVEELNILQLDLTQQDTQTANDPSQEVVFIDQNIDNYDQLLADLANKPNTDVFILDSSVDGIAQISAVLANYQGLDAIHLVSHGSESGLLLGNGGLDNNNIETYRDAIAGWQTSLSEQADLMLYGCYTAGSADGQALIAGLQELTGADVAASDDLTGHASLGGDWDLEYQAGVIETGLVFSDELQQDWVGILPPNAAPVNSVPGVQTTSVNTTLTFSAGNGNLISISDPEGDVPDVTLTVTNGTLTLASTSGLSFSVGDGSSDATMTFNGTIADINAALDGLVYTPTPTWIGAETLTIYTYDNHVGSGGAQSDTDNVTINVNANSAPVLDNSGSPTLTSITEDDLANVGNTIASIVGASITDADGGASEGIAITGLNSSNGTWQYKVDAGAWTDVGAVAGNSALLLKDTDSLRFVPDGDNADTASITYSAWDQTTGTAGSKVDASTTGGTTAFSTASETASITVTAVNDNPIINNLGGDTLTYTEGSGAQIIEQGGDVSLIDVDSSNFDTGTLTISIPAGNVPAEDVLSINHQGSGAGQIGISGNEVKYEGSSIGTFVGGSAGADLVITFDIDATPTAVQALLKNITYENTDTTTATTGARTVQFYLTDGDGGNSFAISTTVNVNDASNTAPTATSTTKTTNEDAPYTFAAADFGYSDADADLMASIKITTLETTGSLQLSGVNVTLNQVISKADIDAGNLKFVPVANANGAGYDSFEFSVNDGTADSAGSYSMTMDVTAVNDAPTGTNNTVTTLEDTAHTFSTANFGFSDAVEGDALSGVKITTLPASGSLTLSGVAVNAGNTISAADITAGKLVFTPVADGNGAGYANFTFQVQDTGGTANGGVDLDQSPNTMTIDVTAVNDAPAGTNNTVTTLEDTAHTFSTANFGFSDAVEGDALSGVKITTLPASGSLTLSGVAVNAGDTISAADIAAGKLIFTPTADANGAGYANFTFQVQDTGGTANGGVDLDQSPNTMTIDVTAVNDAPTAVNKTVTTNEDTDYTFTAADFSFTDVDGDAMASVKITTLEGVGALKLNGVDVALNDVITKADIDAGKLSFTPQANANGAGYDSFGFSVNDGTSDSAGSYTLTVDVTAVNDAPTGGVTITGTAAENQTLTADTSALADNDGLGALSYQWQRDGVNIAGATANSYTVSSIDAGTSITVTTSYTDTEGNLENVTSVVANVAGSASNPPTSNGDPATGSTPTTISESTVTAYGPATGTPATAGPSTIENIGDEDPEPEIPPEFQDTGENIQPVTDAVIDVDTNGNPTGLTKQGVGTILSSLISNQSSSETHAVAYSPENFATAENILIKSVATPYMNAGLMSIDLQSALDELNQHLGSNAQAIVEGEQIIITTMAGVSIALTAGFITWALQGGSLLTALLTTLPVWNTFDPLPVLSAKENRKDKLKNQVHDDIDSVFADTLLEDNK